jgi:hypothetical protein
LPPFDEYTVAYRDRSALVAQGAAALLTPRGHPLDAVVLRDGWVVGRWRVRGGVVEIVVRGRLDAAAAAERYGRFRGLAVRVSLRR